MESHPSKQMECKRHISIQDFSGPPVGVTTKPIFTESSTLKGLMQWMASRPTFTIGKKGDIGFFVLCFVDSVPIFVFFP